MLTSPYLLLAADHLTQEVHRAVVVWRQVYLALNGQHVVHIQLALHGVRELASAHFHGALHSNGRNLLPVIIHHHPLVAVGVEVGFVAPPFLTHE